MKSCCVSQVHMQSTHLCPELLFVISIKSSGCLERSSERRVDLLHNQIALTVKNNNRQRSFCFPSCVVQMSEWELMNQQAGEELVCGGHVVLNRLRWLAAVPNYRKRLLRRLIVAKSAFTLAAAECFSSRSVVPARPKMTKLKWQTVSEVRLYSACN